MSLYNTRSPFAKLSVSESATLSASRSTRATASLCVARRPSTISGTPSTSTATAATAAVRPTMRRRTDGGSGPLEAEADAAQGGDVTRVDGVVVELAPQPRHVGVEGLRRSVPVLVPDVVHDPFARHHVPSLAH